MENMQNKQAQNSAKEQEAPVKGPVPNNKAQQGVDKRPGEEQQKGDQVTENDLKGKKVDRDITDPQDEPLK